MGESIGASREAVLAVDMGGSKFIVGFADGDGRILRRRREEWKDPASGEAVLSQLMTAIDEELRAGGAPEVRAAGVAVPGFVDGAGETASMSLGGLRDWPVARELQERFGLRVFADNDAKCCALAEQWFGSCRDCDDFMYITVSTGVGGAFVLGGKLYYGAFGRAGEIGNTFMVRHGRANGKGREGTLEMYAATAGMAMNYLEFGGSPPADGQRIDGRYLASLARSGDAAAKRTFEREGELLGSVIAQACNMLDIERVVLGGGISLAFELFSESLERTLFEQKYWRDGAFSVVPTVLGYEGALVGAATRALLGTGTRLSRPGPQRGRRTIPEG